MLKILLTLIILIWIVAQDLKTREINDASWVSLVALGLAFFVYDIIKAPAQITATLFLLSFSIGIFIGFSIYLFRCKLGIGGGDVLTIVGLSTVTYDMLPFPFIVYILVIGAFLGLSYGLIQKWFEGVRIRQEMGVEVDVPFTLHISLGFLVAVCIL